MTEPIGRKRWAIGDGYIPSWSNGPTPEMLSHEAMCVLNASEQEAHLEVTIYHESRDPVGPYKITVPPKRTKHVRFNEFEDPEPIPPGHGYAAVIESDIPVVVQHTRLDSRQAKNGLFSTIAYASNE